MDPYGQLSQFVHEFEYQRRTTSDLPRQARDAALLRERDLLATSDAAETARRRPSLFGGLGRRFGSRRIRPLT